MKITTKGRLSVLNKEVSQIESNGQKRDSYKLAVMQGAEAGSITCSKDIFEEVKPLQSYIFDFVYDDKYNYQKVTKVDMTSEKPAFGK